MWESFTEFFGKLNHFFNGEPKLMFVATERGVKNTKFDFYDMQFNHMNIAQHYPNSVSAIKKPEHFEKMIELAKKLSFGSPLKQKNL